MPNPSRKSRRTLEVRAILEMSQQCYPACASIKFPPDFVGIRNLIDRRCSSIRSLRDQQLTSRIRARNHYSNQNSSFSCCLSSTLPTVNQRTDKKHSCHKTEVTAPYCLLLSTSPLPHLSSLERSTIEFQRIVAIGTFGSIREPFLPKPLQSSLPKQSLAAYTYLIRSTK